MLSNLAIQTLVLPKAWCILSHSSRVFLLWSSCGWICDSYNLPNLTLILSSISNIILILWRSVCQLCHLQGMFKQSKFILAENLLEYSLSRDHNWRIDKILRIIYTLYALYLIYLICLGAGILKKYGWGEKSVRFLMSLEGCRLICNL